MPKRKFDRALLDETLARYNASHDETKELPTRLNSESHIPFKCACGTPDIKVFRMMVENGGARCKLCTEHERKMKIKTTMLEKPRKFDRALLDETFARDNASHDETKELPTRLNRESHIPFKCACGTPDIKVFRMMVENGGARCKLCTEHERQMKIKTTMLENHGVEYPSQSAEIMERKKATMLENYGVEHGFQSAEIMGKVKATMLEKHGVEHPLQSPEIFERAQKNSRKSKDYTTPRGQVWNLRGYEPLVAPKLIDEYGEDDINQELPRIWWTDSKGVRHKYYCDFYVKSHKLVVEVKGPYTVVVDAEKIVATREAANALGYGYRLIVLDGKGVWTRDEFSPSILGAEGKKPV